MSKLLILSCKQARFERGEESVDWSLLQTIRVEGGVGEPSPGEPPALPRHAHREADDLVGQLGARQAHPQLEPVAESHAQAGPDWMEGTPASIWPRGCFFSKSWILCFKQTV